MTRPARATAAAAVLAAVITATLIILTHASHHSPAGDRISTTEADPNPVWAHLGGMSSPVTISSEGAEPAELTVPGVIHAPITAVGLNPDGSAEVPLNPGTVGWYAPLGIPDGVGSDVYVGHVSYHRVPGAFYRLDTLTPGMPVTVTLTSRAQQHFRVSSVRMYRKDQTPLRELYDPTGPAKLVLITCGGTFDATIGHYDSNVVVVATPTP